MRVLTVNAGSSSVKLRVVDDAHIRDATDLGAPDTELAGRLADFVDRAGALDVAGHRVVHGGSRFTAAVSVDSEVRAELDDLSPLAPLHNPPALAGIDALRRLRPDLMSVACFDTAFHADLPAQAATYPIPSEWVARWGIRRYGFHGLSCRWAVARTAELLGWPPRRHRLVVCHLGSGASVTAVADGRSMDTTMGFTPLEGLVMSTRAGDLDPGVVTWLVRNGVGVDEIDDALEHRSGLAALSGDGTGDLHELLDRRRAGDEPARQAVGVYLHRLRAKIAAMTATLGGLDALVFTGGVGEHLPIIRAEACTGLAWLGVGLDQQANGAAVGIDADIGAPDAAVRTVVITSREELVIAADCRQILDRPRR